MGRGLSTPSLSRFTQGKFSGINFLRLDGSRDLFGQVLARRKSLVLRGVEPQPVQPVSSRYTDYYIPFLRTERIDSGALIFPDVLIFYSTFLPEFFVQAQKCLCVNLI
jgi:hypothetical protein